MVGSGAKRTLQGLCGEGAAYGISGGCKIKYAHAQLNA